MYMYHPVSQESLGCQDFDHKYLEQQIFGIQLKIDNAYYP